MGFIKNILYKVSDKSLLNILKPEDIYPYYHIVSNKSVAHIMHLYKFKTVKQFCSDLDFLKNNYDAIDPIDFFFRSTEKTSKKQNKRFLITFDDGLSEVYYNIYPLLKERGLKAIFFINPNFIDNTEGLYKHYISIIITHLKKNNFNESDLRKISDKLSFTYNSNHEFKKKLLSIKFSEREKINEILELLEIDIKEYLWTHKPYITKEQIQEMLNDGFYFGGHTMAHPPLNQLNHEEQKKEIINSIEWLKSNFNISYSFFAFPFSDKSISKKLINELFEYDNNLRLFGNSGLKKDIDPRIIQRFSLENPSKQTEKMIVMENLYKLYNKTIGKYSISRK